MIKKKIIIASICIISGILIIIKSILTFKDVSAIGIIGAADGPRRVIVADRSHSNILWFVLPVIIIISIAVIIKIKRNK